MSSSACREAEQLEFERYRIGETVFEYNPAEERYKHMLHLVAYDVCNAKRLHRVAKLCEDYGIRVEYSVFECDLEELQFAAFWQELSERIDPEEDAILAYRICGACVKRIESMGIVSRPGKVLLYFP